MKHIPRILIEQKIGKKFCESEIITLDSFDTNHLKNVLKMSDKDQLVAFNDSEEWQCELIHDHKISKLLMLKKLRAEHNTSPYKIHIFFSLFKKQDWLIEKATEIGADYFHPVISEFSNIRTFNSCKYTKIAKQALEQSNRIGCIKFLPLVRLNEIYTNNFPISACIKRFDAHSISHNLHLPHSS